MSCEVLDRQDTVERYLLDQLTDGERDEFERHYLECESCFARLQTNLALQTELQLDPPPMPSAAAARPRLWIWSPVFASLLIVIGLGIWWSRAHRAELSTAAQSPASAGQPKTATRSASTPALPRLEELARVEPPPYVAVVLRGREDPAHEVFRKAMQDYAKGNYAAAISGLQEAVKASPQIARFQFYLGACYLLTRQLEPAIGSLVKAATLDDSTYTAPAHFYLAKAYLLEGNVSGAETELERTVQRGGGYEAEARAILRRLRR